MQKRWIFILWQIRCLTFFFNNIKLNTNIWEKKEFLWKICLTFFFINFDLNILSIEQYIILDSWFFFQDALY